MNTANEAQLQPEWPFDPIHQNDANFAENFQEN
jgi:hypothetical protein